MLENFPVYISLIFGVTTLASIVGFYWVTRQSKSFLIFITIWTILMTVLSLNGFFQTLNAVPPRIALAIIPLIILILSLFLTPRGRLFIDKIDLERLTYFHTIRVPVEIVLALLAHQGVISYLQTFEGANFDVLSGLTAPIVAYLYFKKGTMKRKGLLIWNIICLILVLTIVVISILALPTPLQQISFEQPNIAIAYFPFSLLPTVVVPLVIFGHIVAIKRLIK